MKKKWSIKDLEEYKNDLRRTAGSIFYLYCSNRLSQPEFVEFMANVMLDMFSFIREEPLLNIIEKSLQILRKKQIASTKED